MASYVRYIADGVTTSYSITFEYIQEQHIVVSLNGVPLTLNGHFDVEGSNVVFRPQFIPSAGAEVELRRSTPTSPLVIFTPGAALTAEDLNTANKQAVFCAEEIRDYYEYFFNGGFTRLNNGVAVSYQEAIDAAVQSVLDDALLATLQSRITDIDANAESILQQATTISVLSQQLAAQAWVQPTAPVPGVGGIPDPIPEGARWYDSDEFNKPYVYLSGAWVSIEDPRVAANAADITALESTVNNPTTGVVATSTALGILDTTVVNLDGVVVANSGAITALQTTVNDPTTGVAATASALSSLTTTVTVTQAGQISVIAGDVTALQTTVNHPTTGVAATASGLTSLITEVGIIDGEQTATAGALSTLTTTVNGHTTSISTQSTSIDGLHAQYTVKVDNNGRVAGFGLASTAVNGVPTSSFIVIADKFAIVDPANTAAAPKVPFVVTGGVVYMQNVVIQDALISNLTVGKLTSGTFPNGQTFTNEGSISVGTQGHIRGGMTDYATGTGFYLGYTGGAYKFSVGDSSKYIRWDGSTFTVGGDLIATGNIIEGAVSSQDYQITTTAQNQSENVETTVASASITTITGKVVALSAFWNFTTFAPVPYNSAPITTFKLKRGATVLLEWTYTGVYSAYDVSRFWIDNPGAGTFTYTVTATQRADPNGDNGTPQTRAVHYIALEARQLKR